MGWLEEKLKQVEEGVKDPGRGLSNLVKSTVEPIGKAVEDIAKGIEANPVKFILQTAAAITPGMQWAIPVIEGIDVAAKGGNVEDVFKAAAISYVSQQAGQYVGSKVSGAVGKSLSANDPLGFNFDPTPHIAAAVAGGAASGATVAAITGQDLLKGAVSGGITGGVRSVLNSIDGFADLKKSSPAAANAIQSTVIASLTGRDPSKALINSLISSSELATKAIKAFDPKNGQEGAKMTPTQTALATDILMGTMSAALTGGNASAAVQAALLNAGTKALGDMVKDKVFTEKAENAAKAYKQTETEGSKVAAAQKAYEEKAKVYTGRANEYNAILNRRNDPAFVNGLFNEYWDVRRKMDTIANPYKYDAQGRGYYDPEYKVLSDRSVELANTFSTLKNLQELGDIPAEVETFNKNLSSKTQADADALQKKIGDYNRYMEELNANLKSRAATLNSSVPELDALEKSYVATTKTYEKELGNFNTITQQLMTDLNPTFKLVNQLTVEAIDPTFKAEEYREIAGLKPEDDPYAFFLKEGQLDLLPTNMKAAEAQILTQRTRLVNDALKTQGQTLATADPREVSKILDNVDRYGNNLTALKTASAQDILQGSASSRPEGYNTDGNFYLSIAGPKNYGAWNKPSEKEFSAPAGMKLADQVAFTAGTARNIFVPELNEGRGGNVWVVPDTTTIPKLWNPKTGTTDDSYFLPMVTVTAPRVTNEDIISAVGESPGVWEEYFSKPALAGAKAIVDVAKSTGNSTIINTAAGAMKAVGGFLESVGSVAILAGVKTDNNKFVQFASSLEALGKANTTEEYQKEIDNIKRIIDDGKGVGGKLNAIWDGFKSAPGTFVAEYVVTEGMQEALPWLLGGGVGLAARGVAGAMGVATKAAQAIGVTAGAGTKMVSDIAEAAGGAAKSAYDDAYNTAIKVGKPEEEAERIALQVGQTSGVFAAGMAALTMGVTSKDITEAFTGKANDTLTSAWDRLKAVGKATAKEAGFEFTEEGLTQAVTELQLYKLDPTRDVAGNITEAAAFGAIAGGAVAGSMKGAGVVGSALAANPKVAAALGSATSAADAEAKLRDLGITDKTAVSDVLNTKYNAAYTSTGEARDMLTNVNKFNPSQVDIDALVGATPDSQLRTAAAQYVNPRQVTEAEAQTYFTSKGYTPTKEEVKQFAGQFNEAEQYSKIEQYVNPQVVTEAEARKFFADQGYTPTDAEVKQFVGRRNEAEQIKKIAEYTGKNTVTEAEARRFLVNQGYNPTDAEVKQFVGQFNEAEQAKKIGEYVAPRLVTEQEVKAAYDVLGLKKPTQADVLKLVGQYDQTTLGEKATANLDSARYNSIIAQLETLAGSNPAAIEAVNKVKQDLNKQITSLGGDVNKLIAGVNQQVSGVSGQVGALATDVQAKYDTLSAQQKATVDALTQQGVDLNTAINNVSGQVGALATDVQAKYDTLSAQQKATVDALTQQGVDLNTAINNVSGQVGALATDVQAKYDTLSAQQKATVDALTQQGVDLNTAINNVSGQVGALATDVQAKYDTLSAQQKATVDALTQQGVDLNTAINNVSGQVGALATTLGRPGTQATQQDLDSMISLLESQGAYDPQYDYNGDKKVDQLDRVAIENALRLQTGQNIDQDFVFQPAVGSMWAPTGVFADIAGSEQRIIAAQAAEAEKIRQAQLAEAEKTRQEQIRQANLTRQAQQASALRTQRMGNINTLQSMLMQSPDVAGQQVTVKAPDPAKIGYMYDWSSIFANPAQEKMFVSPYAQGGTVQDVNDELLNILRG